MTKLELPPSLLPEPREPQAHANGRMGPFFFLTESRDAPQLYRGIPFFSSFPYCLSSSVFRIKLPLPSLDRIRSTATTQIFPSRLDRPASDLNRTELSATSLIFPPPLRPSGSFALFLRNAHPERNQLLPQRAPDWRPTCNLADNRPLLIPSQKDRVVDHFMGLPSP